RDHTSCTRATRALSAWLYVCFFFFFNDTATTEIYTLSLHDALPICLLISSGDLVEYLDYELTRSRESEISIPILKDMSGKIKRSSELRMRSLSLPGLTSQYIAYVQQLLEVLPNKLLICIDELDKITDLDSVRSILSS